MDERMGKITKNHLSRKAILYIRQSTMRQVYENTESTLRQYALRDRLIAYGWDREAVIMIDRDLGQSGSSLIGREGFQQLIGEVANGNVGVVACIECSRLSRSSNDWVRLTEYCAMTSTLLMDADGVYNPNDFNDRLLLGLKGTMSEAELHFLKERMRGGLLNKAKRGELKKLLPIGYLYDDNDRIIKDTDAEVRHALELFFESFRIVGTAWGMLKHYEENGYKFPHRVQKGLRKGDVIWTSLTHSCVLRLLHNPIYAGVYHYGAKQKVWTPEGKKTLLMPKEKWLVFIKDQHEGYITYEEYEFNEKRLWEHAHPRAEDGRKSPPREGPALLQGIVVCGKCGKRMTVRYKKESGKEIPYYMCQKNSVEHGERPCQGIQGLLVDEKISEILLMHLTPLAVRSAIEVQEELVRRKEESSRYYQMRVEKSRYEADLARRRYMQVDPDNRLVALELESAWNIRLKELDEAQKEYEDRVKELEADSKEEISHKLDGLPGGFMEIWNDADTSIKDKKRMVRYLLEDVTLLKSTDSTQVMIHFRGGTTETVTLENAKPAYQAWITSPAVLEVIRKESIHHTAGEIAEILNEKKLNSGKGQEFHSRLIQRLMKDYQIPTKKERYESLGYVDMNAKAAELKISRSTLVKRLRKGIYAERAVKVTDRNEYLFAQNEF